ncbi:MAG: hypothetical protein MJ200_02775 [Mycoplasmoidaceae bacterium]|nr:hypothetical protein [Mycoplasmoidaceae bacterium]
MMVYAVDFGSPQGTIKTKLDNLNQYSADHGCINHFVDPTSQEILNKDKFVAGYPYRENEEGTVFGGC